MQPMIHANLDNLLAAVFPPPLDDDIPHEDEFAAAAVPVPILPLLRLPPPHPDSLSPNLALLQRWACVVHASFI